VQSKRGLQLNTSDCDPEPGFALGKGICPKSRPQETFVPPRRSLVNRLD
jgi:hypothetical protein